MTAACILIAWLGLGFFVGYVFGSMMRQRAAELRELPEVEILDSPKDIPEGGR